jgi:MoxR-like ATPase
MPSLREFDLQPAADRGVLEQARRAVAGIRLNDDLIDYIIDLVRATRETPALLCGASPRSANMLAVASRARAALNGRPFVIPDDIKELARPVLRHRLPLAPGAEIEGTTVEKVVGDILDQVPAPR